MLIIWQCLGSQQRLRKVKC